MFRCSFLTKSLVLLFFLGNFAWAQESESVPKKLQGSIENIGDKVSEIGDQVSDMEKQLNEVEAVQEASAGILQPIYDVAEYMNFPAFYWVAFTLMTAGLVSFAGQLVFSKFFLLFRMSLSIKEILADALGLLISLVGLVMVTQAATENSASFVQSPMAVVSATGVGVLVGLVFYLWGQRTEFDAARGAAAKRAAD